jgi:phthiocerol/phenolphthiocerol synthesis type-I polyketide synthase E
VVALRGERRLTQVLAPRPLDALEGVASEGSLPKPETLRERGVYLITGGLGGLGLTVADYLGAHLPRAPRAAGSHAAARA